MSQKAVLIVNTRSRRGRDCFSQAQNELSLRKVEIIRAIACRDPKQVPMEVGKAISAGEQLVIVGGGDGTLSSIVGAFVGTESVLGVLPLGTGNEFARDLNVPSDVAGACDVIASGKTSQVDLGVVNGEYFINVATIGLTTLIAQELTNEAKKRWGKFVYFFALLHALARSHPFQATLKVGNEVQDWKTLQVVIGNGRFHAGPFPLAPDASITDGKLVVYALVGTTRWELLRFALNLPGGHHVELPNVPVIAAREGILKTTPPKRVTVDGEISQLTPLVFSVAPGALKVRTPMGFR